MAHKKKKKKLPKKISKFIKDKFYDYKDKDGKTYEFKKYKSNTPPVTTATVVGRPPIKLWKQVNDLIKNKYYKDEIDLKKEVDHIEPQSEWAKFYKKTKQNSISYSRRELLNYYDKITRVGKTGRRKQKFKISKVPELIPLIKDRRKINDIESFDLDDGFKVTGLVIKGKRQPLTGLGLYSYMERNKINHVVDIIKAWPKDKSLKVPSWKVLMVYLKSLNFTPEEVLDGAIMSSQTKKRFIEKRIFREFEQNAEYAVNNLVGIYRKFLKTKKPFKTFLTNPEFIAWCKEEDIHFDSDNHCRDTVKKAVKLYNKKNPKDKIPEKLK